MRKSDSRRNICSKEVTREYFFRKGVDNAIRYDKIELRSFFLRVKIVVVVLNKVVDIPSAVRQLHFL